MLSSFKIGAIATAVCLLFGLVSSTHHHHLLYGYENHYLESYQHVCAREFYSVVFDAGSTGSRVFVFQLRLKDKGRGKPTVIKLHKENYYFTEPGISSLSENITEVSVKLAPLLKYAETHVPRIFQHKTLLSFKATAGLRLLPEDVGEKILSEVRFLLKKSSFHIPDLQEVEVMGGDEEGIYGWMSANFLLDKLWHLCRKETAVAIDLGGGSVQITFALSSPSDFEKACSLGFGKVFGIHLLKSSFDVFTHSALGFGLKSAQLHIMGGQEEVATTNSSTSVDSGQGEESDEDDAKDLELVSSCFVPGFSLAWNHGRYTYTLLGREPDESRLEDCKKDVDTFVKSLKISPAVTLSPQEVYLFSYFCDVAQWAGVIPPGVMSMELTPSQYLDAAEVHCSQEAFSKDKPFLCMDLLYIHSLLTNGLGYEKDRLFHVGNELNGKKLSWSLGLALFHVNNQSTYTNMCTKS